MPSPLTWSDHAKEALATLARRPLLLLVVMLAFNAVTRPYGNIAHDTRLYSVQVLNRIEHGSYQDDLFFRYGSQDEFSLFSPLMAPLVTTLGLAPAFLLMFLIGNTLFLAGMLLLVRRLIDDPAIATLSLLYLSATPLNYGGLYTLQANESFLTPRLLAESLVLFGLTLILNARFWPALALMLIAGMLHPLMATGGVLMWAGFFLVEKLGWKRTGVVLACICGLATILLALPAVAGKYLGIMEDDWREISMRASPFNFTSEWEPRDWMNVLVCAVGLVWGVVFFRTQDSRRANFLGVVIILGIAAGLGTYVAEHLPYALLLQGQPYRSLWILKVLQAPLCFALIAWAIRSGKFVPQIVALFLAAFFLANGHMDVQWLLPVLLLPLAMVFFRGLESQPKRPDWLVRSFTVSFILGAVAWGLFQATLILQGWDELRKYLDTFDVASVLINNLGIMFWMTLTVGLISIAHRCQLPDRGFAAAGLILFLGVHGFSYYLSNDPDLRIRHTRYLPEIQFARDYLHDQYAVTGKKPTVYSQYGKLEFVWLELKANSYFDWWQTSGFLFKRQTSLEGQRRALLAGPFEVARFQEFKRFLPSHVKDDIPRFFKRDLDAPAPTVQDLARLCQEESVDYLILKQEFPGLVDASNGQVFVYDCRKVCEKLRTSEAYLAATR